MLNIPQRHGLRSALRRGYNTACNYLQRSLHYSYNSESALGDNGDTTLTCKEESQLWKYTNKLIWRAASSAHPPTTSPPPLPPKNKRRIKKRKKNVAKWICSNKYWKHRDPVLQYTASWQSDEERWDSRKSHSSGTYPNTLKRWRR